MITGLRASAVASCCIGRTGADKQRAECEVLWSRLHSLPFFAELVVTNMTRRILKFLHEEYATALANYLSNATHSSPATPHSVPETPFLASDGSGSFPFTPTRRGTALGSMFDLLGHNKAGSDGLGNPNLALGPSTTTSGVGTPLSSSPIPTEPSSPAQSHSPATAHTLHRPNLPVQTPGIMSPHVTSMLEDEFSKKSHSLKPVFIEAVQELMDEVELTYRSVGEQSIDHIHSGCVSLRARAKCFAYVSCWAENSS